MLRLAQRRYSGKLFAFHPFEEGTARCGDVAEILRDPGMSERGHGIAAARKSFSNSFVAAS